MYNPATLLLEEKIETIRSRKQEDRLKYARTFIAQKGGQQNMLSSRADITIGGGSRGGSKSFSLLMLPMTYFHDSRFRGIIFRKALPDLDDLMDKSKQLYSDFGTPRISKDNLGWAIANGGSIRFSYHDGDMKSFDMRFRGKEFAYIGIDEVTQIDFQKFKMITTCNRNAYGLPNRIFATCNPDPDTWVAQFIDWWIGPDGLPIPERDGVLRYCYMRSDTDPSDIVWGDSKEEVFSQVKDEIMMYWQEKYSKYGAPEDLFIMSVTFKEAKLADNDELMRSDPTYLAKLRSRSEEQVARDLGGNWRFKAISDDIIKYAHMERFYNNPEQLADGIRRASCDVALDGGDRCTLFLRIGNHFADAKSFALDSRTLVNSIKATLEYWHVREDNFTYDQNGIGKYFDGFFRKSVPFNNKEAVSPKYKGIFYNLKAHAFQSFADKLIAGELSIDAALLERRFSGKGYKNTTLRDRLMLERKIVRFREDDPTRLIGKDQMKKLLAGASPDWWEGLVMSEIFFIKQTRHRPRNMGYL